MTQLAKILTTFLILVASSVSAQTNINLGGISVDPNEAVEISADSLSVDQDTGVATFSGNVVVGQGPLRLSAGTVEVVYAEQAGEIAQLRASNGVTFATATEAAEATSADYNLIDETLLLTGNVLLTQGASAISANEMRIDLNSGDATLSGGVRTVFQQSGN